LWSDGYAPTGEPARSPTNAPEPEGERPRSIGFVKAPIERGGTRWVAYIWDFIAPMPDSRARGEFLLHELFHRVQPDLGLMTPSGNNQHLDTVDGRYWLRLEWRALAAAIRGAADERARALSDAVTFRRAGEPLLLAQPRTSASKNYERDSPNIPGPW
jgi:hypothetical protein